MFSQGNYILSYLDDVSFLKFIDLIVVYCTRQCIYVLHGHTSTIRSLRVLHNRPIAVSGSRDSTLRVWDVQHGKCLRILAGHHESVRCLDVCGNRVVSGSYDNTCRVSTPEIFCEGYYYTHHLMLLCFFFFFSRSSSFGILILVNAFSFYKDIFIRYIALHSMV